MNLKKFINKKVRYLPIAFALCALSACTSLRNLATEPLPQNSPALPALERFGTHEAAPLDAISTLSPFYMVAEHEWSGYLESSKNLQHNIEDAKAHPERHSGLFNLWIEQIDLIKQTTEDPFFRVFLADVMTSKLMRYDTDKASVMGVFQAAFNLKDWIQPVEKSLEEKNGLGVCVDYAVLKMETLKQLEIPKENIRVVTGIAYEPGVLSVNEEPHMVLLVSVEGQTIVLDTPRSKTSKKDEADPVLETRGIFTATGYEKEKTSYTGLAFSFRPLHSFDCDGNVKYYTESFRPPQEEPSGAEFRDKLMTLMENMPRPKAEALAILLNSLEKKVKDARKKSVSAQEFAAKRPAPKSVTSAATPRPSG